MDMSSFFPPDGMGNMLPMQVTSHVSFRAGILNRDPTTNRVTADPRKGVLQIVTTADELTRLQWRPRNQVTVEQDWILFPGGTEMKQVNSCPASARVYVLKWKEDTSTRVFVWMQGPDASQDATNVAAVNSILEDGPGNQQSPSSVTPSAPYAAELGEDQTASRDTDVTMTTAQNESPPPNSARGGITLDQLRAAMPRQETAAAQRELILTTPTLVDLLNGEQLQTLLANPRVQELLPSLFEHLPEQDRSTEGLNEVLRSLPFRAQAGSLSHALQNGGASDILRSFGLPVDEDFSPYGLKAFLESLVKFQRDSKQNE